MNNSITTKIKGKRRYKPLYKNFNQILENPQLRQKIFKFKKKKWEKLQNILKKRKSYKNRYPIFEHNHTKDLAFFFSRRYMRRHKDLLHSAKKLSLFYGGLKKKYVKNALVKVHKKRNDITKKENELGNLNFFFVDFMERRLEAILHRSLFVKDVKTARQLIRHGYVYVNKHLIKSVSSLVEKNDIIEVDIKFHGFVLNNIASSNCWPTPPKNLLINYKTLQILYIGLPRQNNNFSIHFPFKLNLQYVTNYYRYN